MIGEAKQSCNAVDVVFYVFIVVVSVFVVVVTFSIVRLVVAVIVVVVNMSSLGRLIDCKRAKLKPNTGNSKLGLWLGESAKIRRKS